MPNNDSPDNDVKLTGDQCFKNISCDECLQRGRCKCCKIILGETGPTGPTGATGPAGPPSAFTPTFGTIIGTGERTLEPNTTVPFNTILSVAPAGITFTSGSPVVTVINAGIYQVMYELVTIVDATIAEYMALMVNGSILPNSEISLVSAGSKTSAATVALNAGSTLGIIYLGEINLPLNSGIHAVLDVLRVV